MLRWFIISVINLALQCSKVDSFRKIDWVITSCYCVLILGQHYILILFVILPADTCSEVELDSAYQWYHHSRRISFSSKLSPHLRLPVHEEFSEDATSF